MKSEVTSSYAVVYLVGRYTRFGVTFREVAHSFVTLVAIRLQDMEWIHLAQDRDKWRAVVNTAVKRRVLQNALKFLTF
jgi:hypothetical protein